MLRRGFSLVEMAIIIVIISLFTGVILSVTPTTNKASLIDANNKKLDEIEKAIIQFVKVNTRLPCTADITIAPNSSGFGLEIANCNASIAGDISINTWFRVRGGMVPVRTLGLPDDYAFDAWGNRIRYSLLTQLGRQNTGGPFNFTNFFTGYTSLSPTTRTFEIRNESGNLITRANSYSAPTENNSIAYVLVSHGENGNGAVPYAGGTPPACTAAFPLEQENCNNDRLFRDARFNLTDTNYFDDFIRWKTYNQLRVEAGVQNADATDSNPIGFDDDTAAIVPSNADSARLVFNYLGVATSNTLGISSISGFAINTWMARAYNTVEKNFRIMPLIETSPTAGQFTLQPGIYKISAQGYLFNSSATNIAYRIVNVTSGEARTGPMMTVNANTHDNHGVNGVFTVTTNSVFRVEVMVSVYSGGTRFVNNINLAGSTFWPYFEIEIMRVG